MKLIIEVDGDNQDMLYAVEHVVSLLREGHTSGIDPRWRLESDD